MLPEQSSQGITLLIEFVVLIPLGLCWTYSDVATLEADPPKAQPARAAGPPVVMVYDSNPQHLWNRLYSALYVRVAQDGKVYGQDEIDPLLWPSSAYLLTKPRQHQILAVLDEFLSKSGEKMIGDRLKRALFQRDLWAIFDWLADPDAEFGRETSRLIAERRELQVRLAQIIWRLALPADQLQALPDNYAAAVTAKTFPTDHDHSHPDKAYLPANLMESNGRWVALGDRGSLVAAPQHVAFTRGRSSFFVLMNLPGGRQATLDYLEKLRTFVNPVIFKPADPSRRLSGKVGPLLNPNLPQFPVGTQVALVREIMLLDDKGKITPTRLVESVQIRVYHDRLEQSFFEFRLRRQDLFAGKAGGLHAVGPEDREFAVFSAHDVEPFEELNVSSRSQVIMNTCNSSHSFGPGIHAILAYNRAASLPADLGNTNREQQEFGTRLWKQRHYSWGLLQGILAAKGRK